MRSAISPYHSVSGPLVRAIADNLTANLRSQRRERFVRRVIQALVSIPIWLVFVLLSPFDAYAAAQTLLMAPEEWRRHHSTTRDFMADASPAAAKLTGLGDETRALNGAFRTGAGVNCQSRPTETLDARSCRSGE
jgi:hypothetical protein